MRLRARLRETARVEGELRAAVCLAESASSAKSQFLANMSHELRTPLNAIIGYSEMLLEDADEPDVATDLGRIRSSGRHLLALINDMLDLARVEAGRLELERSWFDVSELVNEVAAVMFPAADERGDMLVLDFAPDIGTLHADPVRVRQILLNLLSNAVKFTRDGTVTLRARRERRAGVEHVLFEIEDTGIGIAEHQQSRLFRPFVQAHSGVSGQYGGTGLGLALSARFAEMMEGEIGVRSELGVGSTFTFSLPVNSTSARMEDLFESRVAEAAESERPVVLCVDSDTTALDLLCRALSAEGYHPVPVRQGDAVVELARRLAPVAVTLDTGAAGIDGWATLATLRGDPSTRATPVIAISTDHDAARCLARGAREFVGKPVRRELLRDALARCRGVEPQRASA
ncbi:MAG: response regulator [Myxococcales bacterium]|nr:response regulator [Myxococcales bacterium]